MRITELIDAIDENCVKAFVMNKHVQTNLKDKIFKMVIRALSQLNYRIIYPQIFKASEDNVEDCPKKVKNVDPDERCNQMYVALTHEYEVTKSNKDILAEVIKKYWTDEKEDRETKDYIWEKYQTAIRKEKENRSSKLIAVEEKWSEQSPKKELQANILKTTMRKYLEYNKGHCSQVKLEDQIKTIIIQAIEYQKTKDKLQSLYGEHIVEKLREGDREKVKTELIEKYFNTIKDKPVETKPFKINKTDANLIENFEKDLLNTITKDERQVRIDPNITAKLTEILSEKELDTIQHVSYFLIKTIIQELGYSEVGEEASKAHQDCIKKTEHLHEQFRRKDNIKYFGKYLERNLYNIKFATNLIHDKSDKAVHLYKTFESEYTENSNCIKGLRRALVNKIQLYQKILRYSSLLKEWKGEKRSECKNERKIVFNRNPIGNNTVIYRQNEFDMGYEISLSEPNKLIDASIVTYINVDNGNSTLVKEAIDNQPYINLGDTLPGELKSYTTILKLEFISKMNHDISVELGLEDKVVHTSFKIDLELNGGVHVVGLIRPNGPRKQQEYTNPDDMNVKWKVLNVREDKFELHPDLSEVEDLEACSEYFQ
uniref:Uncharacterized protein n=1 Tax=Cacopsylla melanoneura TaxID=428564 RepID=A0A8D9FGR5_9HEMI